MLRGAVLTLFQVLSVQFGTKKALPCSLQSTTCVKIFLVLAVEKTLISSN